MVVENHLESSQYARRGLRPSRPTLSQHCLVCGELMGIMPGSRDAICHNCGYKDPCCE